MGTLTMNLLLVLVAQSPAQDESSWREGEQSYFARGEILEDLDVMQRVLARKIAENSEEICGEEESVAGWPLLNAAEEAAGDGVYSSAFSLYGMLLRGRAGGPGLAAGTEYLPGYGAVIGLAVPVETNVVPEAGDAEGEETKGGDSLWDEMEREVRGTAEPERSGESTVEEAMSALSAARGAASGSGSWSFIAPLKDQRIEFSERALSALEETILDTVAHYAERMAVPPGEHVSVCVRLHAGSPFHPVQLRYSGSGSSGSGSNLVPFYRLAQAVEAKNLPRRLVITLRMKDVARFEERGTSLEELRGRAQIDYF
jgi:hypothetical protein